MSHGSQTIGLEAPIQWAGMLLFPSCITLRRSDDGTLLHPQLTEASPLQRPIGMINRIVAKSCQGSAKPHWPGLE